MDIVLRATAAFAFVFLLLRILGRRELSTLEPFDVIDHRPIERCCGRRMLVVRKIAAGHEQRVGCVRLDGLRDGGPERERRRAGLLTHYHRHNGHVLQQARDERHLHFQTVLPTVSGGQFDGL